MFSHFLISALALTLTVTSVSSLSCRPGYRFTRQGTCFRVVEDNLLSWEEARAFCKSEYHDLVQFNDLQDEDEIMEVTGSDSFYWMGLNDKVQEGHYVWLDDNVTTSYTNWGPDQPTESPGYNCGSVSRNSAWTEMVCNSKRPFICAALAPILDHGEPGEVEEPRIDDGPVEAITPAEEDEYFEGYKPDEGSTSDEVYESEAETAAFEVPSAEEPTNEEEVLPAEEPTSEEEVLPAEEPSSEEKVPPAEEPTSEEEDDGEVFVEAVAETCNAPWRNFNDGCIKVVDTKLSWYDARANCQREDADLMVVPDMDTHIQLRGILADKELKKFRYWFGLNIGDKGGDSLMWLDQYRYNEAMMEPKWCSPVEDEGERPYCGLIVSRKHARWNNATCTDKHNSICMDKDLILNLLQETKPIKPAAAHVPNPPPTSGSEMEPLGSVGMESGSQFESPEKEVNPQEMETESQAESSGMEPKSSEMEPKSPEVEPESSEIEPVSSEMEPKSPEVEPQSSEMEPESSEMEPKSPEVEPESSEMEPQSSEVEPEMEPKSPEMEPKSPDMESVQSPGMESNNNSE